MGSGISLSAHRPKYLTTLTPPECSRFSSTSLSGSGKLNGDLCKFKYRQPPVSISVFLLKQVKVVVRRYVDPLSLKFSIAAETSLKEKCTRQSRLRIRSTLGNFSRLRSRLRKALVAFPNCRWFSEMSSETTSTPMYRSKSKLTSFIQLKSPQPASSNVLTLSSFNRTGMASRKPDVRATLEPGPETDSQSSPKARRR